MITKFPGQLPQVEQAGIPRKVAAAGCWPSGPLDIAKPVGYDQEDSK
jgi:hypothetical protein